jgi:hypothetical protein
MREGLGKRFHEVFSFAILVRDMELGISHIE